MKKYYPIFISKKGELAAFQHIIHDVKGDICPVFEVISKSINKTSKDRKTEEVTTKYNEAFEKYFITHWSFDGNQIILDFSCFQEIETNIFQINRFINSIIEKGVNVVLAIQHDSNTIYKELVKRFIKEKGCKICIRFTNLEKYGSTHPRLNVEDYMTEYGVNATKVILLIDLGFVTKEDYQEKSSLAYYAITFLPPFNNWADIVVASGSFPVDLSVFKDPGVYYLPRYEWQAWGLLVEEFDFVRYGDFGTKHPAYDEVGHSGTISVRYTIQHDFLVHRGKKTGDHKDGHGQFINHAKAIVASTDYLGKDFSFGDALIEEKSKLPIIKDETATGNPTTWLTISFNHHVTLIHSLL